MRCVLASICFSDLLKSALTDFKIFSVEKLVSIFYIIGSMLSTLMNSGLLLIGLGWRLSRIF